MENVAAVSNCDLIQLISKLIELKVFNNNCECGNVMKTVKCSAAIDKYMFICQCGKKRTTRKGSWLANSHLNLHQLFIFINLWVNNVQLKVIEAQSDVCHQTAVKLKKFLYSVVTNLVEQNSTRIGGDGQIVEIGESEFGKRKYNKGHLVEGVWVFGGVERGSMRSFLVPVEKRDERTLLDLIKKWIHPNSTIISDCLSSYGKLEELGYKHLTVNHSVNYKDPYTGAHTNTIESYW